MEAITPAALVFTPYAPRAVTQSSGVSEPTACLTGGETLFTPGAQPASLVLDFGEELVGILEITVEAESATTVELIEGEDLEEALLVKDPFPSEHWYHQPRDVLSLQPGAQAVRNQGRRAFRYVNILVHGPGRLRLRRAQMTLEHAPVAELGSFSCSDALLNDAWSISRRTMKLCMQGFYEDGIKRDGMLWIGDLATPGGLHQWVLDNYCADFVCGIWEYVLHTGDTALARELAPVVHGVLDFLSQVDLAVTKGGKTFITDNQPDDKDWWGSRSALAYQIAAAFADGAKLADLLGDGPRADRYRTGHRTRLPQAAAKFGDPAQAECRDDFGPGPTRSWHAHAAAFLAGALTSTELRTIYPLLQQDAKVRRPMAGFMEFYLLQAWMDAGLVREALDEMRSYYGQMLRSGATTTWELVDRREPGIDHIVAAGRSHCHGWSAGPANLLPAKILGVTPTAPGYREVSIRPALGDLTWAKGEIPTPHGQIRVSLTGPTTGEVTLPAGVTGTLQIAGRAPLRLTGGRTHPFN